MNAVVRDSLWRLTYYKECVCVNKINNKRFGNTGLVSF